MCESSNYVIKNSICDHKLDKIELVRIGS